MNNTLGRWPPCGARAGLLVQLGAASVGVGATIAGSIVAATVLKLAGADYLIMLGVRAIRAPMHRHLHRFRGRDDPVAARQRDRRAGCRSVGDRPPYEALAPTDRVLADRLFAATQVRGWSAHAALLVAAGILDVGIQLGGQRWDYAALALLVTEAGGLFTTLDGRTTSLAGDVAYSNGRLHPAVLTALTAPEPAHARPARHQVG